MLRYTTLPLITQEQCALAVKESVYKMPTHANLCTGPLTGGYGGCSGDSGGPMIQEMDDDIVQVGIASWAIRPCGDINSPTGYLEVAKFHDWIINTIGM